jgi:hypothetical protein
MVQPTNRSLLSFEAQTKKLSRWFWGPNHQTRTVLRPKLGNPPPPWFWGLTKKPSIGFEVKPGETVATSFEAKLEKTVATGFEAKLAKTVRVVLRPNYLQTVDLGFEAQPRNPHS